MPLEGHFQRVNTPLRRLSGRERNVVIAALAITVVSIVALLVATAGDSRPAPAPGCIYALVPGATGATPIDACGARAQRLCARHATLDDPGSQAIEESCRRAGVG